MMKYRLASSRALICTCWNISAQKLQSRMPTWNLERNLRIRSFRSSSSWRGYDSGDEEQVPRGRSRDGGNRDQRLGSRQKSREMQYEPGPDLLSLTGFEEEQETQHTLPVDQEIQNEKHNYGLQGKGKSFTGYSKARTDSSFPQLEGEILYGIFPVLLSLREGRRTPYYLHMKKSQLKSENPAIAEIRELCDEQNVSISPATKSSLDRLSYGRPHQGICLDTSKMKYKNFQNETAEEDHDRRKHRLWLFLDCVQDPMNFGAIIRSSYFLGVDRIIVPKMDSCSPSPVVSKASAGALEIMDIYAVKDAIKFIQDKKMERWNIMGTAGQSAELSTLPLHEAKINSDTLLVLGNEGMGLSQEIISECDQLIAIQPGRQLAPGLDSLNVSTATGIILHQLLHSR